MSDEALLLRRTAIFKGLSESEAQTVAASCTQRVFLPGQRLFDEGEPGKSLMVVVRGMAALTRKTPGGHTMQIGHCRAGEVLGEMALLDPAPRSATATAISPLVALEMRRATFDQLVSTATPAASKIIQQISLLLSSRLRGVIERIEEEILLDAEDEAILNRPVSYQGRAVQPVPPPKRPIMPDTLVDQVSPVSADTDTKHGELWRVLWGVSR